MDRVSIAVQSGGIEEIFFPPGVGKTDWGIKKRFGRAAGWGLPRFLLKTRGAFLGETGEVVEGLGEDQVRTGARVARLIGRKFHVSYSVSGASRLMHRLGFTPQVPARRAAERDEQAVAAWKEATWETLPHWAQGRAPQPCPSATASA